MDNIDKKLKLINEIKSMPSNVKSFVICTMNEKGEVTMQWDSSTMEFSFMIHSMQDCLSKMINGELKQN